MLAINKDIVTFISSKAKGIQNNSGIGIRIFEYKNSYVTPNGFVVFRDDFNVIFNFIFNVNLNDIGGNPCLKEKTIAKLIQIKEKLNLCDIYRTRNPKTKCFTFQ